MNNVTKIKIGRPAAEVFEAFVDPSKIGNFWFSSSSERWEQGKTITIAYDEYNARGDIAVLEIEKNKKIVFRWGSDGKGNVVTISLEEPDRGSTIVTVNEEGFDENDENLIDNLVDNKEGWIYALTCLKAYLEFGVTALRAALVK
ncbi:hypothetical protein SD70_30525 [Gordoniibacillus kamchatkensis]|uniref:Activator of Hsp90 ATPase homologue 1/2-like C-terminal domain-containing protein n=1 Tax=Gordoniibacillus kamchatkensis TaxID=1590651 RepID=A0ABR5A9X2_9BACL|nr:SRPBCC family protein [Paenibacillus sp. VKM B-2647]KIL37813.1 hypothetical protein SD70_30525 [Paenibacillus sp. VKM B-2647]